MASGRALVCGLLLGGLGSSGESDRKSSGSDMPAARAAKAPADSPSMAMRLGSML